MFDIISLFAFELEEPKIGIRVKGYISSCIFLKCFSLQPITKNDKVFKDNIKIRS